LLAEHPSHARVYQKALDNLFASHPALRTSPVHIWNMDETDVTGHGQVRKMYFAAGAARTGFDSNPNITNGPHVTCVLTTSPSGKKLPPFFIIAGNMFMSCWWDRLYRRANRGEPLPPHLEKYFKDHWMPNDVAFVMSENGSMTSDILPAYIKHVAPNPNIPLLLLLDGHKSRIGIEWIHEALKTT